MKRSELEEIIREEIQLALSALSEDAPLHEKDGEKKKRAGYGKYINKKGDSKFDSIGTVPTIRKRKMTASQVQARKRIGEKILNAMRRGTNEKNKIKAALTRHAEKHGFENPTRKVLASFVWAMASDYAIRGKDFKTGSGKSKKKSSKEK